jgi:hypothetical protein
VRAQWRVQQALASMALVIISNGIAMQIALSLAGALVMIAVASLMNLIRKKS